MRKQYALMCIIALISINLNGCSTSSEFNNIVYDIEKNLSLAGLEKKMNFSFENGSCSASRSVVGDINCLSDSDSGIMKSIKSLKKVRVATYKINHCKKSSGRIVPKIINKELNRYNWKRFLSVKNDDEIFCCYYKQQNNNYSGIFIFIQNDDNLIIVKLNGDVKKIINKLTKEHHS